MARTDDAARASDRHSQAHPDPSRRGLDRAEWERLTQQSVDPEFCPICGQRWKLVVGCHKVCRCGNMEGCGD